MTLHVMPFLSHFLFSRLQERRRQLEAERLARLEEVQLKKQEQVSCDRAVFK